MGEINQAFEAQGSIFPWSLPHQIGSILKMLLLLGTLCGCRKRNSWVKSDFKNVRNKGPAEFRFLDSKYFLDYQ